MQNDRLETISYIVEDMLLNPDVDCTVIMASGKIAAEDTYLYNLMLDYMKEFDINSKDELLEEIIDYTEEFLRRAGV